MFFRARKNGWIEVITGCMFAGKSSELLRRLDVLQRSKEIIQVFSPEIDDRYGKNNISNHNGWQWPAIDVVNSRDILNHMKSDTTVVVIDEIQFFDKDIIQVIEEFAATGKRVIIGGLSADFRGQPFEITMQLLARAEYITKLESVCIICDGPATRIQRLTNGKPSSANEETITISGADTYQPRCRHCHEVPDYNPSKTYK